MASGYDGGKGTSTANQELLIGEGIKRKFYEFSFLSAQECTVIINGSNALPCPADVGFEINENDAKVSSFKIVEDGIDYMWRGKY